MSRGDAAFLALIEAIHVEPEGFTWLGAWKAFPPDVAVPGPAAHNVRSTALTVHLYENFYAPGKPRPAQDARTIGPARLTGLVEALSGANAGAGCLESATVVSAETDRLVLKQSGLTVWARSAECDPSSAGRMTGAIVRLRGPRELRSQSPGFYMALGDNPLDAAFADRLLRLYWNVTPAGAVRLMAEATRALNREGVAFRLKALNDPVAYARCDAAVLYLDQDEFARVRLLLPRLIRAVDDGLKPETPALTKRLGPGLGLAEDPGQGESFGMQRCKILADGLLRALGQRPPPLETLRRAFEQRGLDPDRPYLNSQSNDRYAPLTRRRPGSHSTDAGFELEPIAPCDALAAAADIATQIVDQAHWWDDRCTWLGAALPDGRRPHSPPSVATLGPDLYGGCAGVAVFLSQAYKQTGDARFQQCAEGALRQSLALLPSLDPEASLGLYTGGLGVAFACAACGQALGKTSWLARASRLVSGTHPIAAYRGADLLSGHAGAIVAILALAARLGEPGLVETAAALGEELISRARRQDAGWSWSSPGLPGERHLTGLSHGAAGVGLSLLQLHAATGDTRFREAGLAAFAFERSLFSPEHANWPDLREASAAARGSASFGTTWCHGAPGIALSRLFAYQRLGDPVLLAEAETAVTTTAGAVLERGSHLGNFSLCHGLAGNAEVLLEAERRLPASPTCTYRSLSGRVAAFGARAYAAKRAWPCGTGLGGGQSPSLMVGWAGIGLFYLRLSDPATPSMLLIDSSADQGVGSS